MGLALEPPGGSNLAPVVWIFMGLNQPHEQPKNLALRTSVHILTVLLLCRYVKLDMAAKERVAMAPDSRF